MGFGNTTTTAGGHHRFGQSTVAGGYDTTATGGGGTIRGGPKLCVETESSSEITIHMDVLQEITTSMALFGKKQVYFEISGYTKTHKESKRKCLPKEEAEALLSQASFEQCTENQDQSFTPFRMGGEPPIFAPTGRTGKLLKYGIRRPGYRTIKKVKPKELRSRIIPNPGSQGIPAMRELAPIYKISPVYTWQKVNLFKEFEIFVLGSGNYMHHFGLDITFKKDCPPALCGPCGAVETAFGTTTQQPGEVDCEDQHPYDEYSYFNIEDTLPLDDWINIDEGDGGADGYLDYNEPFWTPNSISPTTPYQKVPVELPGGGPFADPATYGTTPEDNVLVQGEGPGYARWQGFGVDIFHGRDNSLSQGLHQLRDQLRDLINRPSSPQAGSPFCGPHSGDFNAEEILRGFAQQWEYNSNWHDIISELSGR